MMSAARNDPLTSTLSNYLACVKETIDMPLYKTPHLIYWMLCRPSITLSVVVTCVSNLVISNCLSPLLVQWELIYCYLVNNWVKTICLSSERAWVPTFSVSWMGMAQGKHRNWFRKCSYMIISRMGHDRVVTMQQICDAFGGFIIWHQTLGQQWVLWKWMG